MKEGKISHACIIRNGFELESFVGRALIDMYAKCESLKEAFKWFEKNPEHNLSYFLYCNDSRIFLEWA